eukprot:392317-Rhodomonas_salina.1
MMCALTKAHFEKKASIAADAASIAAANNTQTSIRAWTLAQYPTRLYWVAPSMCTMKSEYPTPLYWVAPSKW